MLTYWKYFWHEIQLLTIFKMAAGNYFLLAVITRPPDRVLLAPNRCSAPAVPRLITRAVISRRPDGVS